MFFCFPDDTFSGTKLGIDMKGERSCAQSTGQDKRNSGGTGEKWHSP